METERAICINVGLDYDNLPEPLTIDYIQNLVEKSKRLVEREIGYPLEEEDFEETYSSNFLELGRILRTSYKNMKSVVVKERKSRNTGWTTLEEGREYDVDLKQGKITFFLRLLPRFQLVDDVYNDLKIEGIHGGLEEDTLTTDLINDLVIVTATINLFSAIKEDNAGEMFSIGEFSVRPIPARPDGKTPIQLFEEEREYLLKKLGVEKSSMKFRII